MSEILEFAVATARAAGKLLCRQYDQDHSVHCKSTAIDIVTEADIASERLIVDAIRQEFPDHGIISEEGLGNLKAPAADSPPVWLVDPLDGTVNYAHGYPLWGVSLALAERGWILLAVTYDPLRNEIFTAQRGEGAWCNGKRVKVSKIAEMHQALVATGFAYKRATVADNNLAEFGAIMPHVQGIRRAGSAVLDLAHLASGRLDGYWEMHLQPWDWAAGWLLVEEAGGKVTGMRGEPWSLASSKIVASNGLLHPGFLSRLAEAHQPR